MDNAGKTPLQNAIESNNYEMSKLLLKYGANISPITSAGKALLELSIEKNCSKKLRKLLKDNGSVSQISIDLKPLNMTHKQKF